MFPIAHRSYPEIAGWSSRGTFGSLLVVDPDSFLYLRVVETWPTRRAAQILGKTVQFLRGQAGNHKEW